MPQGPNMSDMFGQIMDMQRKLAQVQEGLAQKTVTAEAGGGMVKVTANGARQITSIKIEPSVIDPNETELLEDLIIAGVNKALQEAGELGRREMSGLAGGLLPPGFDMGQFGL